MSQKKVKAARRVQRAAAPPVRSKASSSFWRSWKGGAVAAAVVALVAGSFVLPGVFSKKTTSAGAAHAMSMGAEHGEGLPVGSAVPSFSESNVETGQAINSKTLFRHKTLLFFSEGVMCQACFEQIKGLEQMGAQLHKRGIELVSITPDSPRELKQAIGQYGIRSPMIADDNRDMSQAFNTLGLGMHGDTPGHAFALIDRGKVRWYHDYWLAPDRTMYVDPQKVIAALPSA